MGMFDHVQFRYRMPDGYEGGSYQTKGLESQGDFYEITVGGRLLLDDDSGMVDVNYSGSLIICGDDCYELIFVNGTLASIICLSESVCILHPYLPTTTIE
ncbi:hypothetical protein ACN09C_26600 (plasmid) [Serratia fonticola]|uniref:hypothetical protein n=1 Tax=Serratia fonticola TaxID=47917 RepID=UPI003B00E8E3